MAKKVKEKSSLSKDVREQPGLKTSPNIPLKINHQSRQQAAKPVNEQAKINVKEYLAELARLQIELVKLQEWVKAQGLKLVVLFEGRDAAGKGGTIKRITECLNPRYCRQLEKWSCSTAAGTTGPVWNGSWASAPRKSTVNSSALSRNSKGCWSAAVSSW
jgi:hypothetical protein